MGARGSCRHLVFGAAVCLLVAALPARAQDRIVEDVRVTVEDKQAVIRLEFGCQVRFVADTATNDGALLEVRVAPFDSCGASGLSRETYRPIGADAAHLVSVEYDSLGLGDSLVLLGFDRPVHYELTQRPDLRTVEIAVDLGAGEAGAPGSPERQPLSMRVVEPRVTHDYIINLQSTREPVSADLLDSVTVGPDQKLYVSDIQVDGDVWHRLRLGFFGTEADARAALEGQGDRFPRAWIGRAEPAEIELAADASAKTGAPPTLTQKQVESARASADLPPGDIAPDEIPTLMAEARSALLAGDNAKAVEIYRRLVQTPGDHRAEALEFLGLAYERDGQPARAREAYERTLNEFPDGPNRGRVEQRLGSVVAAEESPRESLREARVEESGTWDFSTGLSQYYRRDENQFDQDQPVAMTQSALMTDLDFSLRHGGERRDTLARISLSHYRDLLDAADGGSGDQMRVSYAYVDLSENQRQWDLRLGRQSLHTLGVLGRFDGGHFSYRLGDGKRLHLTAGYPVESTRDSVETDRQFVGVAIELTDLVGAWDVSAFLNSQTIEGIDARKAVGMEARYFDERRNFTTMLDYDIDFGELNTVLALGTWRLENRLTLSALLERRMSPILSTRNALIGQPIDTIDEMLLVWTEDEVRRLALDRTAQSRTATLGLAAPLGERLQLNFDVTSAEIDGTVASGGVAAVPGTGQQLFYSASLVATGLMSAGAVNIFNLRFGDSDTYETKLLTWDARFPVGRRLRINPRVRLALWQGLLDQRERRTVSPSLRLLMNLRNRYRLELEVGRDDVTYTNAVGERDSYGSYVNLGYRANF